MSESETMSPDDSPARPGEQDLDRAIAEFSRAIERKPHAIDAIYERALAYHHKRAFPEAIADYDRVIALDPGHADALFKRSIVHRQLGAFDKATADFDRAIQILWRRQAFSSANES
ncbi:tetratricopeptide repeat protein [Labrys sp. LIt4]|uniref:Uncharacterized protein n=1 Tax=Labrys okinawensis TaxID=346911 RepID=A0A2S9Q456_9HYPH|nr:MULTISPECIES: tetratricopeptide repeat protein [Labrys]MBP0582713.1 tetratricopeptide repeat protein [Labrys sp. LIt4]PRH84064.1 hypothetical protein C5L14_28730 [Labrys okinawensis]